MKRLIVFCTCMSGLLLFSGCELLGAATAVTEDTDWKTFTIDSANLGLTIPSGAIIPAIPCTSSDICAQASSQLTCGGGSFGCAIECGGQNCDVVATAEIAVPIDISGQINDQAGASVLSDVSLTNVLYKAEPNTLTFATPQLDFYVGPESAALSTDAGVVHFGTMPIINAGTTAEGTLTLTEAGKNAMAGFIEDYKNPFKMLAKATMTFKGNDDIPQGALTLKVKAFFTFEPL